MKEHNPVAEALGNLLRYADHDVSFEEVPPESIRVGPLPTYLVPYFALSQELSAEHGDEATMLEVLLQNAMYCYLMDELDEVYPEVDHQIYDFCIGSDFIVYAVLGESLEKNPEDDER